MCRWRHVQRPARRDREGRSRNLTREPMLLARFANRVVPSKDVAHGHLLEGPQDQGGGRGGSGCSEESGRRDFLHLAYDPETLAQDEKGGQGPFAGRLDGKKKTAHPRHP
jgi:hypothetical protein